MSRYRFVEAESRRYSVTQLCRIAQVSRTAYYEWQDGPPSQRERDDAALLAKIKAIHAASDSQYGVPRVLAELQAQSHEVGRKRVARLMKAASLRGRRPPRCPYDDTGTDTAGDPRSRAWEVRSAVPRHAVVSDITYIRTWESWLYLATVIDVFSRRVIGFSLAGHLRASLVCDALMMAVATRSGNVEVSIFHSDRGSQYTSAEFRALCDAHSVKQSMGKTGVCWTTPSPSPSSRPTSSADRAPVIADPARTRTATVHWIEAVYNRQRRTQPST